MGTTCSRNVLSRDARVILEVDVIKLTSFLSLVSIDPSALFCKAHSTSWVAIDVGSVIVRSSD